MPVLFADQVYRAYDLPRRYLPFYLLFTLTEFVWPLFFLGIAAGLRKFRADWRRLAQAGLILAWFVIPVGYVLLRRPPMYDGMRHFLFILPPPFVIPVFRTAKNDAAYISGVLSLHTLASIIATVVLAAVTAFFGFPMLTFESPSC